MALERPFVCDRRISGAHPFPVLRVARSLDLSPEEMQSSHSCRPYGFAGRSCILDSLTVDEYIAAKPEAARVVLQRERHAIRSALPAAAEGISYGMPTYKVNSRPVLYFADWKRHFSLYPCTSSLQAAFKGELAAYDVEKGTIRFPLSDPPPVKVIADIPLFRAQEVATPRRVAPRQ
jgi:uncharacterized protein YdhG (YjbR/CyaY superfamily)